MECQKVYLLTLQLYGIFYNIFLSGATDFLVLSLILDIFDGFQADFDVFLR